MNISKRNFKNATKEINEINKILINYGNYIDKQNSCLKRMDSNQCSYISMCVSVCVCALARVCVC